MLGVDAKWVFDGPRGHRRLIVKPHNRRVWPGARAPLEVMLSLRTRQAIEAFIDGKVELSMKAPMSVSKPVDLG